MDSLLCKYRSQSQQVVYYLPRIKICKATSSLFREPWNVVAFKAILFFCSFPPAKFLHFETDRCCTRLIFPNKFSNFCLSFLIFKKLLQKFATIKISLKFSSLSLASMSIRKARNLSIANVLNAVIKIQFLFAIMLFLKKSQDARDRRYRFAIHRMRYALITL